MTTITKPERPCFTASDYETILSSADRRATTAVIVASGTSYTFEVADFDPADGAGPGLDAVVITGLERCGMLLLRGVPVELNEVISCEDLEKGRLQFVAEPDVEASDYDSFLFMTHDGVDWTAEPIAMAIHAVAEATLELPAEQPLDESGEQPIEPLELESLGEPPRATDGYVTTSEGSPYVFQPSDFGFQGEGEFLHVQFTSIETCGRLQLEGVEVTLGQVIAVEDIEAEQLTFEPQEPGKEGFEFKVHDGGTWSEEPCSMLVEVTPFYHPPTASDSKVQTAEDERYVFGPDDFNYNDFDGDQLDRIQITRTKVAGVLRLDGDDVEADQLVTREQLESGGLEYAPAVAGSGDVFWYKVHDGTAFSLDTYEMTIEVTESSRPVYDAPAYDESDCDDQTIDDPAYGAPAGESAAADAGTAVPPGAQPPMESMPAGPGTAPPLASPHVGPDASFEEPAPTPPALPGVPDGGPVVGELRDPGEVATFDAPYPKPDSCVFPSSRGPREEKSRKRQRSPRHYELTVTTKEDTAYVFSPCDLSPDSSPISEIQVESLTICGLLQLDGMAVVPGQRVDQKTLEEGRLTFVPATTGTSKYFDFKVRRGPKWSSATCSMVIEVLPAYNHARPQARPATKRP